MSPLRRSAAATVVVAGSLAVLAGLVATGSLTSLDQYAVDHWMPHLSPGSGRSSPLISAHQLYPHLGSPLQACCNLWTFPASVLVSGVLVAACSGVLVRRGRPAAALAWVSVWLLANAVEVLGKSVLHRPTLHLTSGGATVPLHGFDNSFPSGHAVRMVVLAVLLAAVWQRAAGAALAWALVGLPALVVNADHTPSDVVGGVLLALLALLVAPTELRKQRLGEAGAAPRIGRQTAILDEQ